MLRQIKRVMVAASLLGIVVSWWSGSLIGAVICGSICLALLAGLDPPSRCISGRVIGRKYYPAHEVEKPLRAFHLLQAFCPEPLPTHYTETVLDTWVLFVEDERGVVRKFTVSKDVFDVYGLYDTYLESWF